MNLTPRELRVFISLARSLNFGLTAEQFFVTQPTMSKMIRSLEDKLGVKLFERTTRSVSLTSDGRDLLEVASRVVDDFEVGVTELEEVARRGSQRLSIAALPSLAAALLPDLVAHLRQEQPSSIIKIHDVINDAAIDLLRLRKVDFALSGLDVVYRDLSYIEIMREPFVLLASRAFPVELRGAEWCAHELAELPMISMPRGTGTRMYVDMAFMKRGVPFRPLLEIQGLPTIGKFVQKGCGVAILPLSAAHMVLEADLYTIPLKGGPERTIGVITRHESGLSEFAVKAIEWISEFALSHLGKGG
ncbi:LysR family transcriptional regulator [Pusillimonas sp. ANT_WB101]|uniref:LysR family transcriptional regulator n=1 Tax=Pusillimonas sp. ANT_WB101 TaxID=2597356 RepID=UPI0011F06E1A|nr:LysR family transcriptional regulator [Pusillimonas sp. ANT_WB101]KAA0911283.1 LysR family transcriptional regulator [Pusillimonas sp. ANT_WB101]